MTEACSRIGSRSRLTCEDELSAYEQSEASSIDEERAAEARRNAYFAEGGDEGGRCWRASSDATAYAPMLKDDPALKDARRTAAVDRPLASDPWGNALAAGVVGGVVAGVRAAAAEALLPFAGSNVVEHIALGVAKEVAKKEASELVKSTANMGPEDTRPGGGAGSATSGGARTAGTPPSVETASTPAGWSTASATSALAEDGVGSCSMIERPWVLAP